MARRAPLPRLTQRQRVSRWQRERKQQAVYVIVFSSVLFFVLGLASWAAADRYYSTNLKAAAEFDGAVIPMRDYARELKFQLAKFYVDFGVPPEFENDPRLAQDKDDYEAITLTRLLEFAVLDRAARVEGVVVTAEDAEARFQTEMSQFRSRHVLVTPDAAATDKDAADKAALEEAKRVAAQLREKPNDQDLWNKLAKEHSDDPGSKDSGGELGWVGKGQFVKEFEEAALSLDVGAISEPVKSQFGYHVIQVQERRGPEHNELVKRWLAHGFTMEEIRDHVRYDVLRDEFTKRAKAGAVRSPALQVRIAQIRVNTPPPSAGNFESFTAGLKKLSEVQQQLDQGVDFAEVAKKFSDDEATKEKGGEVGWVARGMLPLKAEERIFQLEPGARTDPVSFSTETYIYKVLEKDPARALDDDQKKKIEDNAYQHWVEEQMRAHGARRLIPGLEG